MEVLGKKISKGQIYQSLISSFLLLIYLLGLSTALIIGRIDIAWITDRFIGLSFIGIMLLIVFPVWRQSDNLLIKFMKQMGVWSFVLLILTWFIFFVQMFGIMQPTGMIETVIFDLCQRFAYYTWFPLAIIALFGQVQWDELLELGDPENR